MKNFYFRRTRSVVPQKIVPTLEILSMAKGFIFVLLVCLANYAAGQGSESDQCLAYRQGYPAYYTCMIKCFQFVLGFNDSTASFCTNKFRLTKASRSEYTNTHAVNTLKCIAIKCREFVPADVCEDSSPGIGSSTEFIDFTTAFSTTLSADEANSGLSTSAPSSSGTTVEDSTSLGLLSTSGDSVNTPPSFINAGTPPPSSSPDNSVPSTTPSPPADDATEILISNGDEQPSDSVDCDEDGDDMGDGSSSGGASKSEDSNPYYIDEGCDNSPSPDDDSSASDTSANSGGESSSASATSDSNNGDGSSANAASDSSGGDNSSASAASDTNDGDSSSASADSDSNDGDDSSANAAADSSGGDSSSASAVSVGGGENSASADASSPDNDGEDSSANSNSDLDFLYYFLYDDDDEQSNSTFNSNSKNASATNLFSTSVQPAKSTPQPSIGPISSNSGVFPESPNDASNDNMSSGDETSDNQSDSGKKYYDYAQGEAVVGQDGRRSNSFSDSQGGNNYPQVPQNPKFAPFGSNPPQSPVYYRPQAPTYNLQQVRRFNTQREQAFNPQLSQEFNPKQAQEFNPQPGQEFNLEQAFNPQQAQVLNPQQGQAFNPQQRQTFNSQAQEFNFQQAQAYNQQEPENYPQQAQAYNQQEPENYPQQAPVYNSQQRLAYNSQQIPKWNNNNWNFAQQRNRRQRIPIQNKWNRRQQDSFPLNNQGYQWNQENADNNGGQGNPANIPLANNGRFLRKRGNVANNVDY